MKACATTAICKCTFSVGTAPLAAVPPCGVMTSVGPLATVQHFAPMANIPPMGLCLSSDHPVFQATGAPGPCTPLTTQAWSPGSSSVKTSAGAVLTSTSMVKCELKGTIMITMPGIMTVATP